MVHYYLMNEILTELRPFMILGTAMIYVVQMGGEVISVCLLFHALNASSDTLY